MNDEELLKALDARRPSSLDDELPEMAALAERLKNDEQAQSLAERFSRLDARIGAAMHQAPIPAGLQQRLLERLARQPLADQEDSQEDSTADEAIDPDGPTTIAPPPARRSRRTFLLTVGALAAVAASVAIAVLLHQPVEPISADRLVQSAIDYFVENDSAPVEGEPLDEAPADFPAPRDKVNVPPTARWRTLGALLGDGQMIAYDLTTEARHRFRATLYVLRIETADLPTTIPSFPALETRGVAASAWQEGPLAYVLVVRGGRNEYRGMLKNIPNWTFIPWLPNLGRA
jgi:hypothetical protein